MNSWISEYLNEIRKYHGLDIYIYGAGNMGKSILKLCRKNNIFISGFCVTNASNNVSEIDHVVVLQFDKFQFDPDRTLFLIGFNEHGEKRLEKMIRSRGAKNVIALSDELVALFDERESLRIKTPIIEVTPKVGCSVNCKFCPQQLFIQRYYAKDHNRKNMMSFEEYKKYLNKVPSNTIIDFSGFVEPFLNPDALKMMQYTASMNHKMTLYTTFRNLSYEQFQKLKILPFDYVCLHTPDIDHYANIPITDDYIKILQEAIETRKPNGEPFIDVANCQSEPDPKVLEITNHKIRIFCELQDRAGNLDSSADELIHVRLKGPVICTRASNIDHNVLLPDGTLVLCCNDFGLEYEIGNLSDQSYEDIIYGEKMMKIRQAMESGNDNFICRKCFAAKNVKY